MALSDSQISDPLPASAPRERCRHFWVGLVIVLVAALVPRMWGVMNTDVIQRDGVMFIHMAKAMATEGFRPVVERYNQHVGYPALLAMAHEGLGLSGSVTSWERTGQIISVVTGTLATVGLWAFAGLTINWRIAWVSASLFAVGRKWSMLGADVMSDATALCFWIWAIVAAVVAVRWAGGRGQGTGGRGQGKIWGMAGVCGVLGGLAYLVRPEGLGAVIVAFVVWGVCAMWGRLKWREAVAAAVVCGVCAGAVAAPYVIANGSLTKKSHLKSARVEVSRVMLAQASAPAVSEVDAPAGPPARGPASNFGPVKAVVAQTIEALNPAVFGLICVWVVSVAYHLCLPVEKRQPFLKFPKGAGAVAMVTMLGLYLAVVVMLRMLAGYLDWRHCMTIAFAAAPLAGAGLVALFDFVTVSLGNVLKVAHPDRFLRNAWVLLFPVILGAVGAGSLRPLHGGNDYVKNAAAKLRKEAKPGDEVVTNLNWVLHYSQMKGKIVPCWNVANSTYLAKIEAMNPRPTWLVLSERWLSDTEPPLPENLPAGRFEKIGEFKQKAAPGEAGGSRGASGDGADVVHVFRIHWDVK